VLDPEQPREVGLPFKYEYFCSLRSQRSQVSIAIFGIRSSIGSRVKFSSRAAIRGCSSPGAVGGALMPSLCSLRQALMTEGQPTPHSPSPVTQHHPQIRSKPYAISFFASIKRYNLLMMASSEEVTDAGWTFVNRDKSAENGIFSGETNTASTSSEMTVVDIPGGNDKEARRARLKKNERIYWTQTRRILIELLARFVIARGPDTTATIASLEPTATTTDISKKDSVGDISSRVIALQQEILAGNTGKEQEEELGRLIASAIFSRLKDKSVAQRKEKAIHARQNADLAPTSKDLAGKAKLLEEAATIYASRWLSLLVQKGIQVITDKQSSNAWLDWISELDCLD
jgi:hypothetical protein